jgi:ribulose-phosphate 3-epimerase
MINLIKSKLIRGKKMAKLLSASLMCADLTDIKAAVKDLENAGIEYIHLDIMDGAFVPNITLGFDLVNSIKKITDIPLDVHMMVNEPGRFIDRMNLDSNDIICVHYESDIHIHRTLEAIKNKGVKAGLALNPHTPVQCMENLVEYMDMALIMTVSPGFAGQKMFAGAERKTKQALEFLKAMGYGDMLIEVDGNISLENGKKLYNCGADIFVMGTSSLYLKDKELTVAADDFRKYLD